MKKMLISSIAGLMTILILTGCASTNQGEASRPAPAPVQLQAAPGMEKIDVTVIMEDKRPEIKQIRYGSSNMERPEHYFNNTINLVGYTVDYLGRAKLFRTVSMTKRPGSYTLKLVWRSSHLNINAWIPFVIRFQNHMTVDMILIAPDGKVVWTYALNGHVVNFPSSFRAFGTHRCDIFQQRVLNRLYPNAFRDMILTLSTKLK